MQSIRNEHGAVIVFVTLMIVLLLIMVGMGLDTGHLSYIRSQGQAAVDAAALAAASAIPTGDPTMVNDRVARFNSKNDYVSGGAGNTLDSANITYVQYDSKTGNITGPVTINAANGVRVGLESTNPYDGAAQATPMKSPLFLTPLFNLFGQSTKTTADVSVSAVAVNRALPGLPIVVKDDLCGGATVILDFQGKGGNSSAGWETYYIDNASTTQIRDLWEALPFCAGQPIVDIGYCGNVANGVNQTIVDATLKPMFKADPDRCYLIPVVKQGGNFNQCREITDWASFCPDKKDPFPRVGQLQGTVTCGQSTWTSKDTKCYVSVLVRDKKSGM